MRNQSLDSSFRTCLTSSTTFHDPSQLLLVLAPICLVLDPHQFSHNLTRQSTHDTDFWSPCNNSVLPAKQFHSLRAHDSKAGDQATEIPATTPKLTRQPKSPQRLRWVTFFSWWRLSRRFASRVFCQFSPPITKPMPFWFASSSCAPPVASPDNDELKKLFKALSLSVLTFSDLCLIHTPVPSTISISSGPKLATEDRWEQKAAAMLASRINAELCHVRRWTRNLWGPFLSIPPLFAAKGSVGGRCARAATNI